MAINLSKIVKDCVTGIDGETYDPARIWGCAGVGTFLLLVVFEFYFTHKVDLAQFGIGFGAVMVGAGFSVKLKSSTEPQQ